MNFRLIKRYFYLLLLTTLLACNSADIFNQAVSPQTKYVVPEEGEIPEAALGAGSNASSICTDGTYNYIVTRDSHIRKFTIDGTELIDKNTGVTNYFIRYCSTSNVLLVTRNSNMEVYDTNLNYITSWSYVNGTSFGMVITGNTVFVGRYGGGAGIAKYDVNGVIDGSWGTAGVALSGISITGVTIGGIYIYATEYVGGRIYKLLLSDGTLVDTYNIGLDGPMSIAYHDGYLYVSECNNGGANGKVSKYTTTGTFVTSKGSYPDVNDTMIAYNHAWIVCGNAGGGGFPMVNTIQVIPEF